MMVGLQGSYSIKSILCLCLILLPLASGCDKMKTQPNLQLTLRLMRSDHPAQALRTTNTAVIREIESRTGIKLELEPIPLSSYSDKKRSLMQTNHMPDIMLINPTELSEYVRTGMFLPVSDYMEQMPHFRKIVAENPQIQRLYVEGKLYGFPVTVQHFIQGGRAPMIRTDILRKHNLDIPRTFEELYTVLKKLKEAYPDSAPWTARGIGSFFGAVAFGLGSGFGMYYDPDIGGGSYVYGTNKQEFKQVLAYMNRLYSEGLLDPDFDVNTQQIWSDKLSSGKSFFYYDNNTFALNFNEKLKRINPGYRLELIPYFSNSKGTARGFLYPQGWLTDIYVISSKVKDPDRVVKLFDWLYGPEGAEVSNFGKRGETYEIVNGEPRIVDTLVQKYKDSADPVRMTLSEIGAGLLAISPHVDDRPSGQISNPDLFRWSEQLKNDPGAYVTPSLAPSFTKEERERLTQIGSKIAPLEQDVLKFIIGAKPLSEYEDFAEQLTRSGVPEMENIYNESLARAGRRTIDGGSGR